MKKFIPFLAAALVLTAAATSVSAADMYVEKEMNPICSVTEPKGGGSKDIHVIHDGITFWEDTATDDKYQYDTYIGRGEAAEDFIGYEFTKPYTVKQVVFTEGLHFGNGGWWEMGMVRIEALVNGEWTEIETECDPEYPNGLTQDDFGEGFEQYTFTFDPIVCDGIRIAGMAGGSTSFISCGELQVLAEVEDGYVVTDLRALELEAEAKAAAEANALRVAAEVAEGYINGLFVPFTSIPDAKGGGNKDLNCINDGQWNVEGDGNSTLQYDTYTAAETFQDVEFGYDFGGATYSVTSVEYYEGRQFGDGGWFSEGIKVAALVNGEWVDVAATLTPEYPISDVADDHLPEAQQFVFTFDAVDCQGIKMYGKSSGGGYFVSISELRVKGTEAAAAPAETEAPAETAAPETEAPAETAAPETEAPAETAAPETAAPETAAPETAAPEVAAPAETAPQTFDAGIIAAAAAIVSAAGYAISKKRR